MALIITIALATAAANGDSSINGGDIIAGYRQNFAEFRSLHVQWRRSLVNAENFFRHLEATADDLDKQVELGGIASDERARLLSQAQAYRQMAAEPTSHSMTVLPQDFWTDRVGFQMRIPSPDREARASEWVFPPARARIDPDTLATDFEGTTIISYQGRLDEGFRVWIGRKRQEVHEGAIQGKPPDSDSTHFPPVGFVRPEWGAHWHPFDDFFASPAEFLHVVGEEQFEGHRTYVVERVTEKPNKQSNMTPEDFKKYGQRTKLFEVVRAWVDPSRGYIPLKMEWDQYVDYEGKRVTPPARRPSFQIISEVEIKKVPSGGFYPVRGAIRVEAVKAGYRGPFATIGDLIEGNPVPSVPTSPHHESRWEVSLVEGNGDTSGMFALGFPDNTAFYDARQSRAFITGDAENAFAGATATKGIETRRASKPLWAVLAVVMVVGAFLLAWVRRLRANAALK